jgi:hypothetical protein
LRLPQDANDCYTAAISRSLAAGFGRLLPVAALLPVSTYSVEKLDAEI